MIKKTAVFAFVFAAGLGITSAIPASADASVNFGACAQQFRSANSQNAPGQTGNGPLTIDANGAIHYPGDGGVGCFK